MGRPKGSVNQPKSVLLATCQKAVENATRGRVKDWHPVVEMAKMSVDEKVTESVRRDCYREVAMYVAPKLKAIEHKIEQDGTIEVRWVAGNDTVPTKTTPGDAT